MHHIYSFWSLFLHTNGTLDTWDFGTTIWGSKKLRICTVVFLAHFRK